MEVYMTNIYNNKKIRVGIVGYGNLGKGVELSVSQNHDMALIGVFTRRNPKTIKTLFKSTKVFSIDDADTMKNEIDVMILCGGSATDLLQQSIDFAKNFNIIDSFDTHAKIPHHFSAVNKTALSSGHIAIISVGWDPGLFSLNRLYAESILPFGATYTFWGDGVSQGHSDAIRRIDGVEDAVQYTIPIQEAIDTIRSGEMPLLSAKQKHRRVCFVVAEEAFDKDEIKDKIVNMPDYFIDYDTKVYFISKEELHEKHSKMKHGGFVLRSGFTGQNNNTKHIYEFSLKLESNPEFTASVLTAYARAAFKLRLEGAKGAKTVYDIAPSYIYPGSNSKLRKEFL